MLAGVALLLAVPAQAIDIGLILEGHRLRGFASDPEESITAAGQAAPGVVVPAVGRVGQRWGYLSLHEAPDRRIARFGPFPFGRCGGEHRASITVLPFGEDGWTATFGDCPDGVDPVWILLPGGEILSLNPTRPGALTRWRGSMPAEALAADIAARWARTPPHDPRLQPLPAAPVTIAEAPPPPAPEAAHAAALRAWRTGGPAPRRAGRALAALGPALDRADWFGPDAPPVAIANDAGFWLQQTGGCAEAGHALALLATVLRRDPGRIPAHLNRADAMAHRLACARDGSATAMREELRLYCSARGPSRIPAGIARGIAARLDVPRLDAEACRPRFGAHHAIAAGDPAALRTLLAAHPEDAMEPDGRGRYPLALAIERGDHDAATALLTAGADPDRASTSEHVVPPLVSAAWKGDAAMVRLLLARRARVDPFRPPVLPIHAAAQAVRQHGPEVSIVLLRMMLDAGAPVDAADEDGRTTLMQAVGADATPAVVRLLIDRGAVVNRVTRSGASAAHALPPFRPAAVETLDALVAAGINLNQQDREGRTPLNHLFAWTGRRAEVVRALAARMVAAGADPTLPDNEGRSAVFRAAASGDAELLATLLAAPRRAAVAAQQDPRPVVRRRLAEAEARPPTRGCPCAADWHRVLDLLGPAPPR